MPMEQTAIHIIPELVPADIIADTIIPEAMAVIVVGIRGTLHHISLMMIQRWTKTTQTAMTAIPAVCDSPVHVPVLHPEAEQAVVNNNIDNMH